MPVAFGSSNATPALEAAAALIRAGGDPLEALVRGVNLVEDNPDEFSVGYGGLPNSAGIVECDACVMHGPRHAAGAVGALPGIRNASSVALEVMRRTDHVLLVGNSALDFARSAGFAEIDLTTPQSRGVYERWQAERVDSAENWRHPEADKTAARYRSGDKFTWGTITTLLLTEPGGDLYGCTSTSGLSFKLPGRVGDSPIPGAGLFIDNKIGACGCTGRGESGLLNCTSFHAVELMRQGRSPEAACLEALRVVAGRTDRSLRETPSGAPRYQLTLYALRADGAVGGGAMRQYAQAAHHDGTDCRHANLPYLFEGQEAF